MTTESKAGEALDLNKLLPCPFCGGTEAFVERADYTACFVQCDSRIDEYSVCMARGPLAVQDDDDEEVPGKAGAIRAWNQQAALARSSLAAPTGQQAEPVATVEAGNYANRLQWVGDEAMASAPVGSKLYLAAPTAAVEPSLAAEHRATIEEAAQVLESAAAHNRAKGRTVLERTQQDRADRLRAILAAMSAAQAQPKDTTGKAHANGAAGQKGGEA